MPSTGPLSRVLIVCGCHLFACAAILASEVAGASSGVAPAAERFQIPATDDGLPGAGPIRRHDWFRELWVARRSAWAQQVEQDQQTLVFLGDSITQGWGDDMGGSFPGIKVANRGISGDTTRGVLIRMEEDVLAVHPQGVVLLVGTNDLADGAAAETIASNVGLILARLHEADPTMPVILCEVFPSSPAKQRPAAAIRRINELYAELARNHPGVLLLPTWAIFAGDDGDAKAEEFPDLLHPNEAGYTKWAAALRSAFTKVGLARGPAAP